MQSCHSHNYYRVPADFSGVELVRDFNGAIVALYYEDGRPCGHLRLGSASTVNITVEPDKEGLSSITVHSVTP